MATAQRITIDFDDEMQTTRRLLERVPLDDARRGFKPHEKSVPFDRLATLVAEMPAWPKMALESEAFDLQPGSKPHIARSLAELLETFDRSVAEGRASIATASDSDMEKTWAFKVGGHVAYTAVRTKVLRSFINHLVHHRAQLGVYLRLNDIPVPAIYGPTADEQ